jgi:thioredoxin 1
VSVAAGRIWTTATPRITHITAPRGAATPMSTVNEVTDATFEEVVLKSDKPVLVDYWADWCGPCKQVAPIIEELASTHGDKVTFVKMDTNTNPVTPANNHVLGLPTIQVYVGGELVKAFKGAKPKSVLLKAIEEYL